MSTTRFIQEGNFVDYAPVAAAKAGDLFWIGTLAGQLATDTEAGKTGALRIEGIIEMDKASATVFAPGAAVHYNATTKLAQTGVADGLVGVCAADAPSGTTVVRVKLNR